MALDLRMVLYQPLFVCPALANRNGLILQLRHLADIRRRRPCNEDRTHAKIGLAEKPPFLPLFVQIDTVQQIDFAAPVHLQQFGPARSGNEFKLQAGSFGNQFQQIYPVALRRAAGNKGIGRVVELTAHANAGTALQEVLFGWA